MAIENRTIGILALVVAGALIVLPRNEEPVDPKPDDKCPGPNCPVKPSPKPKPKPRRPWGIPFRDIIGGTPVESGKVSPDGSTEVMVDLPEGEKKHNVGGTDGAGLCVFTAIEYCARWQNEKRLFDFQKLMRQERGGGYPDKVDAMIKKYANGVQYVQHTGGDIEFLRTALRSGRAAGVTYGGYDCHYKGYVAHMVTLVHLDDKWAAISDNNYPKDNQHVWMDIPSFQERWGSRGEKGWAVVLLNPPPPSPPHN